MSNNATKHGTEGVEIIDGEWDKYYTIKKTARSKKKVAIKELKMANQPKLGYTTPED